MLTLGFFKNILKMLFKSYMVWTVGSIKALHPKISKQDVKMSLTAVGTEKVMQEPLTDDGEEA